MISNAAASFLRNGVEVLGILNGYSHLVEYSEGHPMQEGRDYICLTERSLRRTRNSRGILIGTARTNPGKLTEHPDHLADPEKTAPLRVVHDALASLGVDALISIGGDDTLKTANKFQLFQKHLPAERPRISVVHLPKTIDNDYLGIDFTFGYFTAVEFLAVEILNLLADAEATRSYYLVETMGRRAGWLSYGAAIAGEASLVISVEDIVGDYRAEDEDGHPVMNIDRVVGRIVDIMVARDRQGKQYGVVVLAEGLAEYLPASQLHGVPRDEHGHISISHVNLARTFSKLVTDAYERRTGNERKVTGLQLGYESRCAVPHAFDVMLGSQIGVGAYRALVEEKLDGVMVSVSGQLDLSYVPFHALIDPQTLVTMVRFIEAGSDFHRLARFRETNVHN
ncbi:6-phosphofructokinase [soil metagenome]